MSGSLSPEEKQQLLASARETITSYVTSRTVPPPSPLTPALEEHRGCFVTIKKDGSLRGCIGTFTATSPLASTIQEMAISAATRDPRFYPMKADDLADFELEISVLSPLQKVESIDEIIVGEHGLYIQKNIARGVLLPQVATEFNWDRETFLSQICLKAGLKAGEWKDGTEIFVFSAEVFGDR